MNCPMCEHDTKPIEVDHEAEVAIYRCEDCFTAWHVDFGVLLRGGTAAPPVICDGSTLSYLVTDEGTGTQEVVPGMYKAIEAMKSFIVNHSEHNGPFNTAKLKPLSIELSASPDPEYTDATTYFPYFHIMVEVSYDRLADTVIGREQEAG